LVLFAAIGVILFSFYALSQDSTIALSNPKPSYAGQYSTDLDFRGIAFVSIRGSCPPSNHSTTCDLTTYAGIDPGNGDLAVKSITMKIMNTPFVQLAVGSGLNPGPALQATYGEDDSGLKFATVLMPASYAGSTWANDFVILDAPTYNGSAQLQIFLDVQVANTGLYGHNYDLQASLQFPEAPGLILPD
jgi:hypothetical protein